MLTWKYLEEPRYLFLDEIQNLKEWGTWLRTIHNLRKYKIVVTGSTSALLVESISRELRGRYYSKLLLPFSFREYLRMLKINPELERESRIKSSLRSYLEYGGYPEVIKSSESVDKRNKLMSIYDTTLYRDILDRGNVREREVLAFILRHMVSNSGNKLSVSKLHRSVSSSLYSVSKRTIWKYYGLILSSFAVFEVLPYTHSRKKEIMMPKKLYASDPGIYHLISTKRNMGAAMETAVFLHLLRRKNEESIDIRYFSNDYEVDFVIITLEGIKEAIQVAYEIEDADAKKREFNALLDFSRKFSCQNLKIITWDTEYKENYNGKTIEILPLWKYLLSSF